MYSSQQFFNAELSIQNFTVKYPLVTDVRHEHGRVGEADTSLTLCVQMYALTVSNASQPKTKLLSVS
jgi:hypothetical protein